MNSSASDTYRAGLLGGASRSATFIPSLRDGAGSLRGDLQTAHNFTHQRAYWPCLGRVAVNVVVECYIWSFHSGDL